jgi:DNA polymerase III epsilon subunit-like protein
VAEFLGKYDWRNSFALAHNAMFDGAILYWRFGIKPMAWLDTLSMARATDGLDAGNSLSKLVERYGLGRKEQKLSTPSVNDVKIFILTNSLHMVRIALMTWS